MTEKLYADRDPRKLEQFPAEIDRLCERLRTETLSPSRGLWDLADDIRAALEAANERERRWREAMPRCGAMGCSSPATRTAETIAYRTNSCDEHDHAAPGSKLFDLPWASLLRDAPGGEGET